MAENLSINTTGANIRTSTYQTTVWHGRRLVAQCVGVTPFPFFFVGRPLHRQLLLTGIKRTTFNCYAQRRSMGCHQYFCRSLVNAMLILTRGNGIFFPYTWVLILEQLNRFSSTFCSNDGFSSPLRASQAETQTLNKRILPRCTTSNRYF